jgi:hypothetical protein
MVAVMRGYAKILLRCSRGVPKYSRSVPKCPQVFPSILVVFPSILVVLQFSTVYDLVCIRIEYVEYVECYSGVFVYKGNVL